MGGLRKHIKLTYLMMLVGTFALTGVGIPGTILGFAGFNSKDDHYRIRLCCAKWHGQLCLCDDGDCGALYQLL